ncbi:methyl-accepting chemotaxis protein [Candidatus Albibeggiatoa sp. nov. NOAA]|uniref:methyl-accepting chemotaxis protein n=1 Tax=Candidatus Albibeggiatoa sp. nov. NOAA TaxID=3162724 RepID=UPI003302E924|nr:methyl-accepting chemotaxis protein [Thiotrichaceae bacterium]
MKIGTKLTLIGIATCGLIISSFAYVSYYKMAEMQTITEQKELKAQHTIVSDCMAAEILTAKKLATFVAQTPPIQAAFAKQDRQALSEWLVPTFEAMQQQYRVEQFQFHTKGTVEQGNTAGQYSDAISFLRIHQPDKYGDDLSGFRKSVVTANITQRPQHGLEKGVYGLGMRGVVPVFYQQEHIGTVEFGMRFDKYFFDPFKALHNIDSALYIAGVENIKAGQRHLDEIDPNQATFTTFARTFDIDGIAEDEPQPQLLTTAELRTVLQTPEGMIVHKMLNGQSVAVYSKPIQDFSHKNIGVLSIVADRSHYLAAQQDINQLIIIMVTLTLMGALVFIFIIKWMVEKPICHIATLMENIANGYLNEHIHLGRHKDEIGIMHHAVHHLSNKMKVVIDDIQATIAAAQQGDLTRRVKTDELQGFMKVLGEGTNTLVENTASIMMDIKRMTYTLAIGASNEKAATSNNGIYAGMSHSTQLTVANLHNIVEEIKDELATHTTTQAAILEDTSAIMQQFTESIQHNAQHAQHASQCAFTATEIAKQGSYVFQQVMDRMHQTHESSGKISEIISLIDSIAFQTNILALNAAVEAARVGEQGRGFTVVASEVKNLAQRTANAAKEIKSLIDNSVEDIQISSELVNIAGDKMNDIILSITQVRDMMAEISTTSKQQTNAIEHVNQSVIRIDDMTQQNVMLVQKAGESTEALSQQATKLQAMFGQFKLKAGESS